MPFVSSSPRGPFPPSHLRHVFMAATTHDTSMTCGLIKTTRRPRNPSGVAQAFQKPVETSNQNGSNGRIQWVKHQKNVISWDSFFMVMKHQNSVILHHQIPTKKRQAVDPHEMNHFLHGSTLQPDHPSRSSLLPQCHRPYFWRRVDPCGSTSFRNVQVISANLDELSANFVHFQSLFVCHSLYIISMTYLFYSILHCILNATQQHHVSYIGLVLLVTLGHAPLMGCERAHSRCRLKLTIQ